jgi:hypothetical protein
LLFAHVLSEQVDGELWLERLLRRHAARSIASCASCASSAIGNGGQPGPVEVAQSCTLLYRGFAIRKRSALGHAPALFQCLPNAIRRYGGLQIRATSDRQLELLRSPSSFVPSNLFLFNG